jgi:hypothetical protein
VRWQGTLTINIGAAATPVLSEDATREFVRAFVAGAEQADNVLGARPLSPGESDLMLSAGTHSIGIEIEAEDHAEAERIAWHGAFHSGLRAAMRTLPAERAEQLGWTGVATIDDE